jgi:large subunit ribosomal protein L24
MQKFKKGDKVLVIAGKDKGRSGVILSVLSSGMKAKKVIVEGINLCKRHTRGNPQLQKPGGIIEKELPIHVSNVAHINPKTDKATKLGFKFLENGKKVRYFKATGEVLDV